MTIQNNNVLRKAYINIKNNKVVTAEGDDDVLQVHDSEKISYLEADDNKLTIKQ